MSAVFGMKFSHRRQLPGLVVIAALVGSLSGIASAAPLATGPTVVDKGASIIYYNGAQISGQLTSADTVITSLNYGPVGGAQITPKFGTQDKAGTKVAITQTLSQLEPNTDYSYQWTIYDASTGSFTTGPSGKFTTGAPPTGDANPIVPPANPKANGIYNTCSTDDECLADINGVRADQENLPPITLPTNWASLTGAEQVFVFTNLERVSRGQPPIPNLVNTYDDQVQTGIANDADPEIQSNVEGGSIWAGWPTTLGAFLGWMYYDGPGGSNLDCTSSASAGCWGHRDNILNADWTQMDAGVGTDNSGTAGEAALLWADSNAPAAENVVLAWADELQYLSGSS